MWKSKSPPQTCAIGAAGAPQHCGTSVAPNVDTERDYGATASNRRPGSRSEQGNEQHTDTDSEAEPSSATSASTSNNAYIPFASTWQQDLAPMVPTRARVLYWLLPTAMMPLFLLLAAGLLVGCLTDGDFRRIEKMETLSGSFLQGKHDSSSSSSSSSSSAGSSSDSGSKSWLNALRNGAILSENYQCVAPVLDKGDLDEPAFQKLSARHFVMTAWLQAKYAHLPLRKALETMSEEVNWNLWLTNADTEQGANASSGTSSGNPERARFAAFTHLQVDTRYQGTQNNQEKDWTVADYYFTPTLLWDGHGGSSPDSASKKASEAEAPAPASKKAFSTLYSDEEFVRKNFVEISGLKEGDEPIRIVFKHLHPLFQAELAARKRGSENGVAQDTITYTLERSFLRELMKMEPPNAGTQFGNVKSSLVSIKGISEEGHAKRPLLRSPCMPAHNLNHATFFKHSGNEVFHDHEAAGTSGVPGSASAFGGVPTWRAVSDIIEETGVAGWLMIHIALFAMVVGIMVRHPLYLDQGEARAVGRENLEQDLQRAMDNVDVDGLASAVEPQPLGPSMGTRLLPMTAQDASGEDESAAGAEDCRAAAAELLARSPLPGSRASSPTPSTTVSPRSSASSTTRASPTTEGRLRVPDESECGGVQGEDPGRDQFLSQSEYSTNSDSDHHSDDGDVGLDDDVHDDSDSEWNSNSNLVAGDEEELAAGGATKNGSGHGHRLQDLQVCNLLLWILAVCTGVGLSLTASSATPIQTRHFQRGIPGRTAGFQVLKGLNTNFEGQSDAQEAAPGKLSLWKSKSWFHPSLYLAAFRTGCGGDVNPVNGQDMGSGVAVADNYTFHEGCSFAAFGLALFYNFIYVALAFYEAGCAFSLNYATARFEKVAEKIQIAENASDDTQPSKSDRPVPAAAGAPKEETKKESSAQEGGKLSCQHENAGAHQIFLRTPMYWGARRRPCAALPIALVLLVLLGLGYGNLKSWCAPQSPYSGVGLRAVLAENQNLNPNGAVSTGGNEGNDENDNGAAGGSPSVEGSSSSLAVHSALAALEERAGKMGSSDTTGSTAALLGFLQTSTGCRGQSQELCNALNKLTKSNMKAGASAVNHDANGSSSSASDAEDAAQQALAPLLTYASWEHDVIDNRDLRHYLEWNCLACILAHFLVVALGALWLS